jgi:YbgC/YbaW family acyl-CoA thioester hydrolase
MHHFDRRELRDSSGSLFMDGIVVRFQDVDAAGVVFFARLFDYAHAAYEGLLESAGLPLPEVLKTRAWAAPLRHAEADYLVPLFFGDQLSVHVALAHVEETEICLGFRVEKADGVVAAVLQTVHTFLDVETKRRRAVPAELVELLSGLG